NEVPIEQKSIWCQQQKAQCGLICESSTSKGIRTNTCEPRALVFSCTNLDNAVEESNEKHMRPWSELLKKNKIRNTPLSPYLDKELLYNNSLSVDGKKIVNETGFNYEIPEVTDVKLQEIVDDFINLNLWPAKD
ncbi:11233_t:CDS:2, partial [Entrophospora sp. SA101]